MTSAEIRRKFLDFFKARGHQEVPSSPLVPADDPTLVFTNAGMVQFKRVFQGLEQRPYTRAVTCQKCVRAGGKHNDLEQVGHTARHHTFFEMLGNFSFGDYFKQEAIEYAWEWVTGKDWLGIAPERLYITVHHSDDEARRLWRQIAGIAESRIFGLGDKDNFWQMGDTGPCGPCSEMLVDIRERGAGSGSLSLDDFVRLSEAGQLLEIWNLVFMQFDQQADGTRSPLPAPSVDTGAGLERVTSVMQHVSSDYDTDLFTPIIERAVEVIGTRYDRGERGASYRVLADHARAVAFLLADGVYPSNEGRGYVLRRILRRAVRHAWLLGRREPTLVHLARTVEDLMGGVYPELVRKRADIESVIRAEEERFFDTIEGGLARLDELKDTRVLSGEDAFKLYDTYGFPIDLTQLIAAERGQAVDIARFEKALEEQRKRSRRVVTPGSGALKIEGHAPNVIVKHAGEWRTVKPKKKQKWVGYETTQAETDVLKFRQSDDRVDVVLEENPFYVESGGQVSDTGRVKGEGWELDVSGVEKVDGGSAVVGRFEHAFEPTAVLAQVDERRRKNIERNHTATHLVHAALRKILGPHVRQQGSGVAPDRLRFDFAHETGAAAGVRRIEAVTGLGAYALVRRLEQQLAEAAGVLKAQPEHLVKRIETLLEENRKLEKKIEELLRSGGQRATGNVERIGDIELYIDQSDLDDRNQIGALMDAFRASHKRAISVLFTNGDRPGVHVAVTDDLVERGVKAGEIASAIAAVGGGKGGGRPHFASAGAGDPAKLSEGRAQAPAIVRGMLTR